jgi:hypothetical protein
MEFVTMFGLALDGSGQMVEREVHPGNVAAFKASGFKIGRLEKIWSNEPQMIYTLEDSLNQLRANSEPTEQETPKPKTRSRK